MNNPWLVALTTIFVWWFSTGAILWRIRRADLSGRAAHMRSVVGGLPLLIGGYIAMANSADDTSVRGAHIAFLSAVSVWGWFELAFLSGVVAGPNRDHCPPFAPMTERFIRSVGTLLWHEIGLISALILCAVLVWGGENHFGLWTFATLFFARVSAKLNLFLGVPRINTQFLPKPLAHLASHFRHARMNFLFPVSITVLTFATGCWMERAADAQTDGIFIGFVLLTVLTALALLEHWFMVLPLPDQKLWTWMLPSVEDPADAVAEPVPGRIPLGK